MGEAAGEDADRLELLRLSQLVLEKALSRQVARLDQEEVGRVLETEWLDRHLEIDGAAASSSDRAKESE